MSITEDAVISYCSNCNHYNEMRVLLDLETSNYAMACKVCNSFVRFLNAQEKKQYDYHYRNKGSLLPSEEQPFP